MKLIIKLSCSLGLIITLVFAAGLLRNKKFDIKSGEIYFNKQSKVQIKTNFKNDDNVFINPKGYDNSSNNTPIFTEKIIVTNVSSEPLQGFYLSNNNRDFRDFSSIDAFFRHINRKPLSWLHIYNYFRDNITHVNHQSKLNSNTFFLMNYLGYGRCDDQTRVLQEVMSYMSIPFKIISINGHVVSEYLLKNGWAAIDVDQNAFFLKFDNKTLASYSDIRSDPFVVTRTKAFGKYSRHDFVKSWYNMSLYEFLAPIEYQSVIFTKHKDYKDKSYDIYPTEEIIYYHNKSPDIQVLSGSSSDWNQVQSASLSVVEHIVDIKSRNNPEIKYRSACPIYKVVNRSDSEIIINDIDKVLAPGQSLHISNTVLFDLSIKTKSKSGKISVLGYMSKNTFPALRKGRNMLNIGKNKKSVIKLKYFLNHGMQKIIPPEIIISNKKTDFIDEIPYFNIEADYDDVSEVYWQLSADKKFQLVIPNFENISKFRKTIKIADIDDTFLINDHKYYFRVKGRRKRLWGDWSKIYSFKVHRPKQVNNVYVDHNMEKKPILRWKYEINSGVSFHIFASNSKDFIPDIFYGKHIISIENQKIRDHKENKNLVSVIRDNSFIVNPEFIYYRIIAEKNNRFSVPSKLINVYDMLDSEMQESDMQERALSAQLLSVLKGTNSDILQTKWWNKKGSRTNVYETTRRPFKESQIKIKKHYFSRKDN